MIYRPDDKHWMQTADTKQHLQLDSRVKHRDCYHGDSTASVPGGHLPCYKRPHLSHLNKDLSHFGSLRIFVTSMSIKLSTNKITFRQVNAKVKILKWAEISRQHSTNQENGQFRPLTRNQWPALRRVTTTICWSLCTSSDITISNIHHNCQLIVLQTVKCLTFLLILLALLFTIIHSSQFYNGKLFVYFKNWDSDHSLNLHPRHVSSHLIPSENFITFIHDLLIENQKKTESDANNFLHWSTQTVQHWLWYHHSTSYVSYLDETAWSNYHSLVNHWSTVRTLTLTALQTTRRWITSKKLSLKVNVLLHTDLI